VFANVGVEPDDLHVRFRHTRPGEVMQGQNRRVRGVRRTEREPFSRDSDRAGQSAARSGDKDRCESDIGVALREGDAMTIGLHHRPHICQVGVPRDIDVPGDQ
jgi:hypothetical protein